MQKIQKNSTRQFFVTLKKPDFGLFWPKKPKTSFFFKKTMLKIENFLRQVTEKTSGQGTREKLANGKTDGGYSI